MKKHFNFFGFKINTKKFVITMLVAVSILMLLVAIDLLWFDISWYGIFIGLAFIFAVVISGELAHEREIYKDFSFDVVWFVFPLAIIGARIAYVLNDLSAFDSFIDMFKIWEGGLSIFGGIIGGAIGVFIFSKIKKIGALKITDVIAPTLALGQSIGRWGNFINKEVYGFEVTNKSWQWFPFAVKIGENYHLATFFYESVLNLIGFFVLVVILRKTKKVGFVTFTYFIWYGIIRLFLESLRIDKYILYIPGTNIQFSTLLSILFIVTGIIGHIVIYFKGKNNLKKA